MRKTIVDVIRIPTRGPGDVAGLIGLIEAGKIKPASILAILGKTEGNGGGYDFTRGYSGGALSGSLAPFFYFPPPHVEPKIALLVSGGPQGLLPSPITPFPRPFIYR